MANPISTALSGPVGNVLGGVGGLIGGLLPGGPTTTNTNQNTNTNQTSNTNYNQFLNDLINTLQNSSAAQNTQQQTSGTGTTSANLGPQQQALLDQLTKQYSALAAKPVNLSGYQAQQTQNINNNSNLQGQAVDNIMAARGLSTSPVSGTSQANIQSGRVGQINQLNQSIPLLQNQMQLQNQGAASGFLNTIPNLLGTSTSNTGNTSAVGNQVSQTSGQTNQGQTSGGTGYQNTAGSTQATGSSTTQQKGSAAAGIAGLLGGLFSDARLKEEIETLPTEKAAAKILAVRPVGWTWKGSEIKDTGVIAQELQKIAPELVRPDEKGLNRVNYAGLIGNIISTLQFLDKKIEARA